MGTITIVSNAGNPLTLEVKMTVLPVSASPIAASPMLVVTPPVLSFTSTDGGTDPPSQRLNISNPGAQPLDWSFTVSGVQDPFQQNFYSQDDVNWLSTSAPSGTVSPGTSAEIGLRVHNHDLLPGVYTALLTFTSGRDTLDTPQVVALSLTVQPRCGIATNVGELSFTTISGQRTTGNQVLDLSTTPGCTGPVNWEGFSSVSWLSMTPVAGQLQGGLDATTTVRVFNAAGLQPGTYRALMYFLTDLRSQTVMIQLTVLPPSSTAQTQPTTGATPSVPGTPSAGTPTTPVNGTSSPAAAMLEVAPQQFQFTATQGENSPPGQSLTLSNTGGSSLYWQIAINSRGSATWLSITPMGGTVPAGQTGQATVNVSITADMAPGTYSAQVTVTATDSFGSQVGGSPQTLPVTLTVLPACSLQVTPSSLSFMASLLQQNPPAQDIMLKESGNCARPVSWFASVNAGSQQWLILSATSGADSGQGSTLVVHVNAGGLVPGVYNGYITLSATRSGGGGIQNSPQTVSVTLTVL